MWIESHQDLEGHPKLLDLCNKTGWSIDEAIGKLHRLWWWTLRYAEDGNLSRYKPSQFLVRLNEKLSPEELYKILQETNFIEKNGLIHDWMDYAGRYLTAKYRTSDPKKLQRIERLYKSAKSRTKVGQPNQPNQPNQDDLIISQIENLLTQFPKDIQPLIKTYWDRARLKNKSKVITDGRRLTMLNELWNCQERCKNDNLFKYALEGAITHDAPCIGYINAIIKNQKCKIKT
jgi:hypothetical protein